ILTCVVIWQLWNSFWQAVDRRPLQWAVVLFLLSFTGVAVSLFPYIVPYEYTFSAAANDRKTLVFAGVGICIVLPVVVLYLVLGYRVFRGKLPKAPALSVEGPPISSRKTSGHQADLHMS